MTFLHKRVEEGGGTFGSHLRDLREAQGISLEAASRHTKIRDTILRAFEEDRMEALDDPAFAERHLKAYVRYLGGHEAYVTARYRERLKEMHAEHQVRDMLPRMRGVRWMDLFAGPQVVGIAGVLLLGAALGGYVLWQTQLIRTPPPLEVQAPQDGERLQTPTAIVRGRTISEATVMVNGQEAPVDGTGSFMMSVDVPRGTTIITIVASRRRGSQTVVERRVTYESPASVEEISAPQAATTSATGTRP